MGGALVTVSTNSKPNKPFSSSASAVAYLADEDGMKNEALTALEEILLECFSFRIKHIKEDNTVRGSHGAG